MSEPIQIKSDSDVLRDENRTLRSELRAANERVADLAGQIDWKSKARIMTESEAAGIADLRAQFDAMNEQQNKLARYLRDHYGPQIARGEHNGIAFADVLIRYMERGRLPWWKRILG